MYFAEIVKTLDWPVPQILKAHVNFQQKQLQRTIKINKKELYGKKKKTKQNKTQKTKKKTKTKQKTKAKRK